MILFHRGAGLLSLLSMATSSSLKSRNLQESGKCEELYADSAPLVCEPFEGDPKLHAIVFGCNAVNQDEEPPAGYLTQSFTRKCEAAVADDTTWTCYDMAADTDYTDFVGEVARSNPASCEEGDSLDTPSYLYQQTTAEYSFGGEMESGSQSTEVPHVGTSWDPALASEAYYVVVVTGGEPLVNLVVNFRANYVAKLDQEVDSSCDGGDLSSVVRIGCFGALILSEESTATVPCNPIEEMGGWSQMECQDAGEIQFACEGELVENVDAFVNYLGTVYDNCDAQSESSTRTGQLGVQCPTSADSAGTGTSIGVGRSDTTSSYVFDDYYFECGQGSTAAKLDGRYTCTTVNTCDAEPCPLSFEEVIVNADHDHFLDCIKTFNGATIPTEGQDAQPTSQVAPGDYSATFQANWQLSLDTSVCGGDFAAKRLTCLNGNITLIEALHDNVECTSINDSELECEDTSADHFVNGFSGAVFQCDSKDAVPEAEAEYMPAEAGCPSTIEVENSVVHYIQLGVLCENEDGTKVPSYYDFWVECGEQNDFEIMDNAFTCESASVFQPGNDGVTLMMEPTSVHTDFNRWGGGDNDACYEYIPAADSSCIGVGTGCELGGPQTPDGHVPLTLAGENPPPTDPPTSSGPIPASPTDPPSPATPTPAPVTNPPTASLAPFTSPPGTVFSADYMVRFKRLLDTGCEPPDEDLVVIQCASGNMEILDISHPSIVCTDPQPTPSKTSGTYSICQTTCDGEECDFYIERDPIIAFNKWYISEDFATISYRCSGNSVDDADALYHVHGTEDTGETGSCVGGEKSRNTVISQFNVLCPNKEGGMSFVNDDHYFECYSNFISYNVNGNYSCTAGLQYCPEGDLCTVEYEDIAFYADHHNFKECIQTNNGSPVPQPDVPDTTERPAGPYSAEFQAYWAYQYDEDACSGQLTGLKMTCTNGTIELLDSSVEETCEVVSKNEIECSETRATLAFSYLDFARYKCTSFGEIPRTKVEYYSSELLCDEKPEITASRNLAMGIWCGVLGDQEFSHSEKTWECAKENEYTLTTEDLWFTCREDVDRSDIISSLDTVLPIPKIIVETDYRWDAFGNDLCYEYKAPTSTSTSRKHETNHPPLKGTRKNADHPKGVKDSHVLHSESTTTSESSAFSAWRGAALAASIGFVMSMFA